MIHTTKAPIVYGLLALGSLAGASSALAQAPTPISVTGYNRDVIAESTSPSSTQGVTPGDPNESWNTTGFDGNANDLGIPAGSTATSAFTNSVTGGNTVFLFAGATGPNAAVANYDTTNGATTQTLSFVTPGNYSSLAFAAAGLDSGATGTSTGTVNYADGSTVPFTFDASDWDFDRSGGDDIFSPNIDRAVLATYNTPNDFVADSPGHVNLYETDIATDPTKEIDSVTFSGTYTATPFVGANAGVDVFAVSGVTAAPEPSAAATLGLGLLGLAGLMFKARRSRRCS
jgi:hypothetical protein